MRCLLVILVVGAAGALGAQTPPLASYIYGQPVEHRLDWGLSSINTEELWDQFTVYSENDDATNPTIEKCNLMGASDPVTIIGKNMKTIKDRSIYAFQGLMYGEPPTGERRFKRTIKKEPYWVNDTIDATHLGEKCPQKSMIGGVPSGDEDCLNLNVYVPILPSELEDGRLLPVMFFIHGGAFISGDSSLYLPTKLLDHDVILVVIHYRLGNLGFFSLDNDNAPGNAGLWDQITALEWVQENIECFGGDKDRVTIFGESAGSASVNYMMILPDAEGLFHGVIGESGSALEHWAHDPDPIGSAIAIGDYNGCETEDLTELYVCMRDLDADILSMTMSHFVGEDRKNGQMGFRGAAPVTQGPAVSDSQRLLLYQPIDYLTSGNFSDVPLMIGTNKHEGSFVLTIMYTEFLKPNGKLNDSVYLKDDMMIDLLNCFGVHDYTNAVSEAIMDSFVGELDRGNFTECAPGYVDAAGVLFLKAGGWQTAKLHAKHGDSNTFHYSFDFESDDTMYRWLFMGLTGVPFRPGVTHADELLYIFSFPGVMEGHQITVMDRMTKMWTNFAIYGNPTPPEESGWKDLGIPEWLPVTATEHHFMLIQDECTVELEFPQRWHIALEEDGNLPWQPTRDEYDDLMYERDTYLTVMIVFVVAFAVAACGAVFLVFAGKKQKKKSSAPIELESK